MGGQVAYERWSHAEVRLYEENFRLPDPLSVERANVSYNSLQNLANRLHEKQTLVQLEG